MFDQSLDGSTTSADNIGFDAFKWLQVSAHGSSAYLASSFAPTVKVSFPQNYLHLAYFMIAVRSLKFEDLEFDLSIQAFP